MELFYTKTSPYARKILLLADHLGLLDQMTLTILQPLQDDAGRLRAVNPLGKVPALRRASGEVIFDSPVIAELLLHEAGMTAEDFPTRLSRLKLQALADGIMDAAVSLVMEGNRPDSEKSAYWQQRWRDAILRAVMEFETGLIATAGDWHIGSISMAAALDYLRFRLPDIDWIARAPQSHDWYLQARQKDSMIKTDPREA